MFGIFGSKEKRDFTKIEKALDKHVDKRNKKITTVIEKYPHVKDIVEDILKKETPYKTLSCYNKELVGILDGYFKKKEFITDENKEKFEKYDYLLDRTIENNILFLCNRLEMGRYIFDTKEKEYKNKKSKKKAEDRFKEMNRGTTRKTFYLEDLQEILNDSQMDTRVLNALFDSIVRHVGQINKNPENFNKMFDNLINHPNFDKEKLKTFLYSQMSKKNDQGYIDNIRVGDDIDLNILKSMILDKKILEQHEILGLATLPYVSLWGSLVENYFLNQYLIIDFLNMIFKFRKPEEKRIVMNFIRNKLSHFFEANTQIQFMISRYMNGTDEEETPKRKVYNGKKTVEENNENNSTKK